MSVELEVLPSITDDTRLKTEWEELLASCPQATVFNTLGWIQANLLAFQNRENWVLAFRDVGSLVAVIPLAVRSGRRYFRARRWVEFAGLPYADYGSSLVRPGFEEAVAAGLVQFLRSRAASWDGIFLDRFKTGTSFLDQLAAAAKGRGLVPAARKSDEIRLLTKKDYMEQGQRGRAASKSLRKSKNRLAAEGDIRFEVYDDGAQILERLETFFAWHVERFAAKGMRSPLADRQHREFYRLIVDGLAPQGRIWLSVLSCDDKAIAMRFSPVFDGTLHLYSTCFDASFAKYSPSMLQLEMLLEHAFRSGIACVDFGIGESPQKEFASSSECQRLVTLEIYPDGVSAVEGRLYQLVERARSRSRMIARAGKMFRRVFPYDVR